MMQGSGEGDGDDKVLLVRHATGDEEVSASGDGVRGVILMQELPHLSHLAIRARQEGVVFATCTSQDEIGNLVENFVGKYVQISASQQNVSVSLSEASDGRGPSADASGAGGDGAPQNPREESGGRVELSEIKRATSLSTVGMVGSTRDTCGAKSAQCGELSTLSASLSSFSVPQGVCLPFGSMELVLDMQEDRGAKSKWQEGLETLDGLLRSGDTDKAALEKTCEDVRSLIASLDVPLDFVEQSVCSHFAAGDRLIARSSANVEDLKGMSGAGLYDSILDLEASSPASVAEGIKGVWASLYTRRAVLSRHKAGIASQSTACMAVLVQRLLPSEYSFVLHTEDPILDQGSERFVYAEVAPGQGETLASGTQGTPYRLRIEKETLLVEILAFANFSNWDATELKYTQRPEDLVSLGVTLCELGQKLEHHFGEPQDVEGALVGGQEGAEQLYLVQSRPQL